MSEHEDIKHLAEDTFNQDIQHGVVLVQSVTQLENKIPAVPFFNAIQDGFLLIRMG